MKTLTSGIGLARKLFDQTAFEKMVSKEVFPGKDQTEVRSHALAVVHRQVVLAPLHASSDPCLSARFAASKAGYYSSDHFFQRQR